MANFTVSRPCKIAPPSISTNNRVALSGDTSEININKVGIIDTQQPWTLGLLMSNTSKLEIIYVQKLII